MIHRLIIPGIFAGALHGALFMIPPDTPPPPPPTVEVKLTEFVMPVIPVIPPDDGERDKDDEDQPIVHLPPLVPQTPPAPVVDNGPTEQWIPDMPRPNVDKDITFVGPGDYTKQRLGGDGDNFKGLLDMSKLDKTPGTVFQIAPEYPAAAKNGGLTGEVVVAFMVDENGDVHEARVVKSTNNVFDDAAVRAVSRWRFEPGRYQGKRVAFRMSVPIEFSLNDGE